jgi:hypothetical protein
MIANSILRVIICPDLFAAIACTDLYFPPLRLFIHIFSILLLKDALLQYLHSTASILLLYSEVLNEDAQISWDMNSPACIFGFIDVLTTCSLCTHEIVSNVFLVDDIIECHCGHYYHTNCR